MGQNFYLDLKRLCLRQMTIYSEDRWTDLSFDP